MRDRRHSPLLRRAIVAVSIVSAAALSIALARPSQLTSLEVREVKHLAVDRLPSSVVPADVNGDGASDLLVASLGPGTLTVWLGDGRGGFRTTSAGPVPIGSRPNDLVTGDFNGDRRIDVAGANHETDYVSVLLGDGAGGFSAARGSPFHVLSQPHPHGIAAGDFDGDGRLDLVTESRDTPAIEILRGNGDGSFRPAYSVPLSDPPYHKLRAADLDRDGHAEILVPSQMGGSLTIVRAVTDAGSPRWRTSRIAVPRAPFVLAVGELDRNGSAVIAVVHTTGNSRDGSLDGMSLVRSFGPADRVDATARLTRVQGSGPVAVTMGNFDGDPRRREIAVANLGSGDVEIFADTGEGLRSIASPIRVGNGPLDIAAADLDGDGRDEIVTAGSSANTVSVVFVR